MNCLRNTMDEQTAVIALGANLPSPFGDPLQTLKQAIEEIEQLSEAPLQVSSPWLSKALDCEAGAPDFINAVVLMRPQQELGPLALLRSLQSIEEKFGRRRHAGIKSRSLDLDLICWGSKSLSGDELQLPHPRATERDFVLFPLAELVPNLCLPGVSQSVEQLRDGLPATAGDLRCLCWEKAK